MECGRSRQDILVNNQPGLAAPFLHFQPRVALVFHVRQVQSGPGAVRSPPLPGMRQGLRRPGVRRELRYQAVRTLSPLPALALDPGLHPNMSESARSMIFGPSVLYGVAVIALVLTIVRRPAKNPDEAIHAI